MKSKCFKYAACIVVVLSIVLGFLFVEDLINGNSNVCMPEEHDQFIKELKHDYMSLGSW